MQTNVDYQSAEAHTHMNMLQGVISRMAGNSANCKALCTTLVSTVGAVSYAAKVPEGLWIAVIPIVLFCYLDAMYLSLEQGFIDSYKGFVSRLHSDGVDAGELFNIVPPDGYKKWPAVWKAFKSWAVWPLYLGLLVLSGLIMFFVRFSAAS